MKIIDVNYKWARNLDRRTTTKFCVIHHEAGSGMTAEQIHNMHIQQNGWSGIGYHFYVRKDGSIYRGRPIEYIGTHTMNYNGNSIGVCFEGNMEIENLTNAQFNSGVELLSEIIKLYPGIQFKRHKDLNATACPGKNFPFELMTEGAEDMALTGAEIDKRAKEYRCTKDESDWSKKEGAWKKATEKGIVNGKNPCDNITREEFVAVLDRLGLIK